MLRDFLGVLQGIGQCSSADIHVGFKRVKRPCLIEESSTIKEYFGHKL